MPRVTKLSRIKAIVAAYRIGVEPYGDDPEIGAPTAMSEIIAVLEDRPSPVAEEKRHWLEMGEEAKASIGGEFFESVTHSIVKLLAVKEATDHGILCEVEILKYVAPPLFPLEAKYRKPVGSKMDIGYGVLLPAEAAIEYAKWRGKEKNG